jgi:hypothetical protein
MQTDWIPFDEGEYWVEQAFIVSPSGAAVALSRPYIEVVKNPQGKRHLVGKGLVYNLLVVELLEDNDELNVLLDLGGDFKYWLERPQINAGKVFSADTQSSLQFSPAKPWEMLSPEAFEDRLQNLKRIDDTSV